MSTGSKVGIAVGVIAGIVALAAIVAFVILYLKRRNSQPVAGAKHQRNNASVSNFVSEGAAPAGSISDSRLDPTMVETRRNSDGSIFADDQDYSRRILKVTNPSRDSRVA